MTHGRAAEFRDWTCHAPEDRLERTSDIVLRSVDPARVGRVLDLGCGAGAHVRRLAALLPHATVIGVDVSAANIRSAEAARQQDPASARMQFVAADYLVFESAPFDLILSDGVLHFIDAPDTRLTAKLAGDLADGGTLVIVMATDSLYNRVFALVRRGLRTVQSAAVDRLVLAVGRLLHGRQMSDAMLRERVQYMYLAPRRLMGRAFRRQLEVDGLEHVTTYPMKKTSLSQLTHAADVFRRRATRERAEPV